ncbi:MAG: OmpA family protein [Treponema sp.]|nr:OmpA family protein [Treponema sp.]
MKKILALILTIALIAGITLSCQTPPPAPAPVQNPNAGPKVTVTIPELFSPDPDIEDDKMTINIAVEHPVQIKDWTITIQPNRQQTSGQSTERQAGERQGRQRRAFFEQSGTGTPPAAWQWNGRGTSGEMVMSAMDYRFTISVDDVFGNNTVTEGIIEVDIIVRREGNNLRIIVPSIVFPPNAANFNLLSQDEQRANTRIMNMIARALNKFGDYRIIVEGHANPTTPPNTTQRTNENSILRNLSEQRARAVVDFLVNNNGISRQRLSAIGVGGDRTVADYDDSEENWKNRRVEFLLAR